MDVLHAFRVNEFKYRYTRSKDCEGSWQGCTAIAKVPRDAALARMWFLEVTTPHRDDCAHRTMGMRRGVWLEEAGREFIEQHAMPLLMAQAALRPNCNMLSHCSVTNGNDHLT